MSDWSVVYKRSIAPDGTLLFPQRFPLAKLQELRRTMGSYFFSNQFQNEVIPEDEKRFKAHWIKYYQSIPSDTYRFGFIDPAIGQEKHHDYTGIIVVDVDTDHNWYIRLAVRDRLTPTEIVDKMFDLHERFKLQALGVEVVAYQEALLYILSEKMREKGKVIPVTGVKRTAISKNTRILGLVPRFEYGSLFLGRGQTDLEDELSHFPRGKHDDLLDALASIDELAYYPEKVRVDPTKEPPPNDPAYESWYIKSLIKKSTQEERY